MYRNYKKWHEIKNSLESEDKNLLFSEREIWWCSLWENIWDEEDWKNYLFERPVLIIKKFNNNIFFWLPMTSKEKISKFYYFYEWINSKWSVILSQWRTLSYKRLLRKINKIWEDKFLEIKEKFKFLH